MNSKNLLIFVVFVHLVLSSSEFRKEDRQSWPQFFKKLSKKHQPYSFEYGVNDKQTGTQFKRNENSDGNLVTGSYSIQLPDGRKQIVNYKADQNKGYQAEVTYQGEAKYPEQTSNKLSNPILLQPVLSYKGSDSNPQKLQRLREESNFTIHRYETKHHNSPINNPTFQYPSNNREPFSEGQSFQDNASNYLDFQEEFTIPVSSDPQLSYQELQMNDQPEFPQEELVNSNFQTSIYPFVDNQPEQHHPLIEYNYPIGLPPVVSKVHLERENKQSEQQHHSLNDQPNSHLETEEKQTEPYYPIPEQSKAYHELEYKQSGSQFSLLDQLKGPFEPKYKQPEQHNSQLGQPKALMEAEYKKPEHHQSLLEQPKAQYKKLDLDEQHYPLHGALMIHPGTENKQSEQPNTLIRQPHIYLTDKNKQLEHQHPLLGEPNVHLEVEYKGPEQHHPLPVPPIGHHEIEYRQPEQLPPQFGPLNVPLEAEFKQPEQYPLSGIPIVHHEIEYKQPEQHLPQFGPLNVPPEAEFKQPELDYPIIGIHQQPQDNHHASRLSQQQLINDFLQREPKDSIQTENQLKPQKMYQEPILPQPSFSDFYENSEHAQANNQESKSTNELKSFSHPQIQ